MKIAFISTILCYPWGGADTLWTHAAQAANDRGDLLLISASSAVAAHPRISALISCNAKVVIRDPVTEPPALSTRLLRKLGITRSDDARLIFALRSFRPDLVVFSQGGTYDLLLHTQLIAWLQATGTRYRIIANWQEEHPQLDTDSMEFIRGAFAAADRLNFVSTRNLEVTRRHLALPLQNAHIIQNPLRWRPTDVSPWPESPPLRFATVSRLDESKGVQLLLQALSDCDASLPDWQLNIYGQGPYETALRDSATCLGHGHRVQFRGYVRDLCTIWAQNHLMVSPAIDEGVPMTIPEAMLCHRPVLATAVGGAEDWLRDGESGFLCPAPTRPHLAATLGTALATCDQWEAMGRAAAVSAQARYLPEDYLTLLD